MKRKGMEQDRAEAGSSRGRAVSDIGKDHAPGTGGRRRSGSAAESASVELPWWVKSICHFAFSGANLLRRFQRCLIGIQHPGHSTKTRITMCAFILRENIPTYSKIIINRSN